MIKPSIRSNALIVTLLHLTGFPCSLCFKECIDTDNCNSNDVDHASSETNSIKITPTCDLYMGASTIPNAGLGIFSAIDIPTGGKIGTGDLVIPVFDNELGNLIGSYAWRGKDQSTHTEAEGVDNICPGIEAIVNGHTALMNVWAGRVDMDECNLHRSTDPGVGAFTYYHNLQSFATADISAGMELFAEYGDHWFVSDARGGKFENVPLSYDYDDADDILEQFDEFRKEKVDDIDDEVVSKFWDFYRNKVPKNSRVANLLPESLEDMSEAAELGSAKFHSPGSIRSPEWLETEALCIDNLKEGISNIHQAGRGAFATRYLPKGSFVAPMPLLHQCELEGFLADDKTQLYLNYCFGHKSSTLSLCHYGPLVSLINHSKENTNVEVRWSTSTKLYHDDWLEIDIDELCKMDYGSLLFDVVATKDIQPGEEVFLNYGNEWEEAWNNHVKNWIRPPNSREYQSSAMLNKENILRTAEEQISDPYPDNVLFECFFTAPETWQEVNGQYIQTYNGHESYLDLHECQILSRDVDPNNSTNFIYSAAMNYQPDSDEPYHVIVQNIPRMSIKFSDVPYTSDMFLDNAFRHKIMIADDIFPQGWKDLE